MESLMSNEDMIISMTQQDMDDLLDTIVNHQNGYDGVTESLMESQFQLPVQDTLHKIVLTPNNIQNQNTGIFHSNSLENQVSAVNPATPVSCTQNMDSSISNKQMMRIEASAMDPTADISPFMEYLYQSEDRANTNTTTQQNMDDLFSIIENNQTGLVEVPECQAAKQVLCDSTEKPQFQLPVQDMLTQTNIPEQKSEIVAMIPNTGNQIGDQVGDEIVSPNLMSEKEVTPSFTINWGNIEIIDLKPPMNSSVADESKPSPNITGALHSTHLPNQVTAAKQLSVQVTGLNTMKIKTSNAGPLRSRIGRCPRDEIPLYLQPEPENDQDRRKWRRAKTAHENRTSKKTALIDIAKKNEDLMKEMDELKNLLQTVTTERDTYKNTLDCLINKINGNSHC